jgi:hypothetical protein
MDSWVDPCAEAGTAMGDFIPIWEWGWLIFISLALGSDAPQIPGSCRAELSEEGLSPHALGTAAALPRSIGRSAYSAEYMKN